jgi:hypothetical protein
MAYRFIHNATEQQVYDDIPGVGLFPVVKLAGGAEGEMLPDRVRVLPGLPVVSSAVILALTTNATGATFTAFGSLACTALDIVNQTGVTIEYRRGGTGTAFPIPSGSSRLVIGIANANEISVRRVDQSGVTVTVNAEGFTA